MKVLASISIILIAFIIWVFFPYSGGGHSHVESNTYSTLPSYTPSPKIPKKQEIFHCDGRQYCSQMHSYEEAKYFLDHCKGVKMDGDGDGIPCERQFHRF